MCTMFTYVTFNIKSASNQFIVKNRFQPDKRERSIYVVPLILEYYKINDSTLHRGFKL